MARCIILVSILELMNYSASRHVHAAGAAETADSLVKEGVELRRVGNDDAALVKFQRAYKLSPTPKQSAQLGLCEQALGRWADAEKHLAEAIEKRADPWVAKHLDVLRESLETAKSNLGRLEFVGGPAGATVNVNGFDVGVLPLAQVVKVNAGEVFITVTAPDYERWSTRLALTGGNFQRVVVDMSKAGAITPSTESTQLPRVSTDNQQPAVLTVASSEREQAAEGQATSLTRKWWFWTGAAAVVAGAIVTAVLLSSSDGSSPTCPPGVDLCSKM